MKNENTYNQLLVKATFATRIATNLRNMGSDTRANAKDAEAIFALEEMKGN